ncbi:ABC transporter ATP-binding protein [Weissella bombi]|uniref:ABC-2 type transport system ATP-binding protein n=1 Tax=Weissella bombi TaxID=1505725 RepID=A0A1C3YSX4_9LACO|nr:ABC transporter ATP-binding protein [Weissella bombi]SCB73179.1 ABC-2 type transport system ATP-binding protein [Weissella bombi]
MSVVIDFKHVSKQFNKRKVLIDVNFQVKTGEIIGLLGPNGAGKSTLIKIMTGLLNPDGGQIMIFGKQLNKNKQKIRKYLSIAPQSLAVYPQLSVKQNLKIFGEINGLSKKEIKEKYSTVIQTFGLQAIANQKANNLSGGQKRRLHSAIALMSPAKIIFLDEPTVGADVDSRDSIIRAVKNLAKQGLTIIYTTHYLQEMEDLDARIIFLNNGVIQTSGSVKNIIDKYAHPFLKLYFKEKIPEDIPGWQSEDGYLKSTNLGSSDSNAKLVQTVLNKPELKEKTLTDIEIGKADLETAYRTLLRRNI